MKPLKIDLLPPQLAPVWALLLITMAFAMVLATSLWAWSEYRDADVRLQQLEAAQRSQEELSTTAPQPVTLPYEADARRAAIASAFKTSQALTVLEHVAMMGVTPVSVELDAESGLSRVEVEFTDPPILLKYLDELNSGEANPRWHLLRATARTAGQGVGLAVLEARW